MPDANGHSQFDKEAGKRELKVPIVMGRLKPPATYRPAASSSFQILALNSP
jgi:hypothetical protein